MACTVVGNWVVGFVVCMVVGRLYCSGFHFLLLLQSSLTIFVAQGKKTRRKKRSTPEEGKWKERYIMLLHNKQVDYYVKLRREREKLMNYTDLFVRRSRLYSIAPKR